MPKTAQALFLASVLASPSALSAEPKDYPALDLDCVTDAIQKSFPDAVVGQREPTYPNTQNFNFFGASAPEFPSVSVIEGVYDGEHRLAIRFSQSSARQTIIYDLTNGTDKILPLHADSKAAAETYQELANPMTQAIFACAGLER